jgi:hypothetical protein
MFEMIVQTITNQEARQMIRRLGMITGILMILGTTGVVASTPAAASENPVVGCLDKLNDNNPFDSLSCLGNLKDHAVTSVKNEAGHIVGQWGNCLHKHVALVVGSLYGAYCGWRSVADVFPDYLHSHPDSTLHATVPAECVRDFSSKENHKYVSCLTHLPPRMQVNVEHWLNACHKDLGLTGSNCMNDLPQHLKTLKSKSPSKTTTLKACGKIVSKGDISKGFDCIDALDTKADDALTDAWGGIVHSAKSDLGVAHSAANWMLGQVGL